MRYLLVLLLATFQECDYDRPIQDLDTEDLATELEAARASRDRYYKNWSEAQAEVYSMKTVYAAMHMKASEMRRDLDRATRPHALILLERILLERYIDPVDRWFENPALAREPIEWNDRWYVLIVEPSDKVKGTPIWVKFYVGLKERGEGKTLVQYKDMKRRGILDNLERAMVLGLEDPSFAETIREGTAHVYRLPTKDSDPDKVKPEDRIY